MTPNSAQVKAAEEIIARRMQRIRQPRLAIDSFLKQYRQLVQGHTGLVTRDQIEPLSDVPEASALQDYRKAGEHALPKALILKLNGGLGTSMGLDKAKSLLPVKDGRTFLDLVIAQVLRLRQKHGCTLPLVLMDSFNTQDDAIKTFLRYPALEAGQRGLPPTFLQHQVPKIRQDNLMPVEWLQDRSKEWCPPGHGDLYLALCTSGMLTRLLDRGFEYAFVANVDNLGATLDLTILGYFADRQLPFLMEVTERTEADRKGGHIARGKDGRLVLRERAQCPAEEEAEFQDIRKYRYFNTNNLWLNLRALKQRLDDCQRLPDLPLIVNRKPVEPRDAASAAVYQLETAMGAALSVFPNAQALNVPRARFSPVKTTEDLLALWSDAYVLTDEGTLELHPSRNLRPIVVQLDPVFYGAYGDFAARFAAGAPSLMACESLKVEGDFRFGRGVLIQGKVHLRNTSPRQELVEDGARIRG